MSTVSVLQVSLLGLQLSVLLVSRCGPADLNSSYIHTAHSSSTRLIGPFSDRECLWLLTAQVRPPDLDSSYMLEEQDERFFQQCDKDGNGEVSEGEVLKVRK